MKQESMFSVESISKNYVRHDESGRLSIDVQELPLFFFLLSNTGSNTPSNKATIYIVSNERVMLSMNASTMSKTSKLEINPNRN